MRKILVAAMAILAAGTGAVVLGVGGIGLSLVDAAEAPSAPAPASIPVTAGTVEAVDVPVFLAGIGSVQAYNMVTIKTRVDGQIVKVSFSEGQEIKADDPLVQIDPRPYQAALEVAQANKVKDEAQLVSAQLDLGRSEQLLKSNYETRQLYDQQTATVAQLHAAIKGDKAQIDAAQVNVDYCDIRAPISGRLGVRLVDIGNIVHAADAGGLVTITQTKPIFVNFSLAQEHLHKIHEKQALGDLKVQAYGSDNVSLLSEGTLTVIDNAVDQTTGTIRLKGTFANTDERLWPGEFVDVRLILSTRPSAATVPQQAVQVGPNGYFAYVIKADNTVEQRAIEVASIQDGIAVIDKGLETGEKVVVDGQFRLTEGARIRVNAPKPDAPG
jgi:multidrug efflux system membrane fusion protein